MSNSLALVTGAGSGIGKAITLAFAAQGDRVIAADLDLAAAEATAAQQPELITALPVDVADRAQVDALRDRAHAEIGVPTVVVNAAGWDRTDQFLNATTEFAEKVVAINYLGPVHVCSAFLPGMIAAGGGGRVVNLASDAGRVGSAGESIYAGCQGRSDRTDQITGPGDGPPRDHRQLRVSGADRHPAVRGPAGEAERGFDQGDSVPTTGAARRGRRPGAVLRLRCRIVHHRSGDQRQRWSDHGGLNDDHVGVQRRAPAVPGDGR